MMMDYHQKKYPCATRSLILVKLIYGSDKSYYSQALLEECK